MMSVVVNRKMEVSGKNAAAFRNMAVWEGGYNICIDVCRTVDQNSEHSNSLIGQLKEASTHIPLNLSKAASFKPGKQYIRYLRNAFFATKELETLLMICHDLNYLHTEQFLDLNAKLNTFSSKMWKYIKYSERKVRVRVAKK